MRSRLYRHLAGVVAALLVSFGSAFALADDGLYVSHGIAMHGDLKYGPDQGFDYVNPDAPKGGTLRLASVGTYDNLNPFIIKGVAADGINLVFETLMEPSSDEAFSEYGLIAEKIEMPAGRSWVIFTLRAEARWHDGTPITVADVIFSLETLKTQGSPNYRLYYANVDRAEDLGERRVKFSFSGGENRELPLIIGQLPIISKAYYTAHKFDETTLQPPLGSGPYKVSKVESGRSITYERVKDYWGANFPRQRGRYNYDLIRYDYFRDPTVALEAFKAHAYDFRVENSAKEWATQYVGPNFDRKLAIKEELRHELPTGMQGFAVNIRRPLFADVRVRQALIQAFDFEWANKNLFYGQYTRTESYFSNSELASSGLPSAEELALLEPLKADLPPEAFTQAYKAPATDGSGNNRANLKNAAALLDAAGYVVKDKKRIDPKTGRPMEFEFLMGSPGFERIVGPYAKSLARLGIECKLRVVDSSQYVERLRKFDFDMVVQSFGQSLSPGNEQRNYWSSKAADAPDSGNVVGIKSKAIDILIEHVIAAKDRKSLITATRALDRVLLFGYYVVPNWHIRTFRIAYWDIFERPKISPKYGLGFIDAWWINPAKEKAIAEGAALLKTE
ncbi:MAG: ABC transporter substrate-binding protein [Alphaproteobacteria bacterium]|nr:ABC transporter substrate-binding protein [Alphaproteobacteria bacterium]